MARFGAPDQAGARAGTLGRAAFSTQGVM